MFIKRINEGEKMSLGLNWLSDQMTLISFKFIIPIWILLPKQYMDYCKDALSFGWRVFSIKFTLHIRRWKKFPSGTKKIIFHFASNVQPIREQLICARELLEDIKWQ
jgi:hypothetical protein